MIFFWPASQRDKTFSASFMTGCDFVLQVFWTGSWCSKNESDQPCIQINIGHSLPYSPALWCMQLCTKPKQWCMHQKLFHMHFFTSKKSGQIWEVYLLSPFFGSQYQCRTREGIQRAKWRDKREYRRIFWDAVEIYTRRWLPIPFVVQPPHWCSEGNWKRTCTPFLLMSDKNDLKNL